MRSLTLENFRCFGKRQTVPLAPLTLLVGENSTGKTSFLAAVRALWDLGYQHQSPSFRERPFHLGGFVNIANDAQSPDRSERTFRVGFSDTIGRRRRSPEVRSSFWFADGGADPLLFRWDKQSDAASISMRSYPRTSRGSVTVHVRTGRGRWNLVGRSRARKDSFGLDPMDRWTDALWHLRTALRRLDASSNGASPRSNVDGVATLDPVGGSPAASESDADDVGRLLREMGTAKDLRPCASSAIRPGPAPALQLGDVTLDASGDGLHGLLGRATKDQPERWPDLKGGIEEYAKAAGLFDELMVEEIGDGTGIFRVQVRLPADDSDGIWRSISDVGIGVSQILPIVTQLIGTDAPRMFLLQQPEVHLHPVAQAELASFFCKTASWDRQLIVETHSQYLIDRVRMDVRDGEGGLKPDDVLVLYFERHGPEAVIHEVRYDDLGNVSGGPPSYGDFFMAEVNRAIWPREKIEQWRAEVSSEEAA